MRNILTLLTATTAVSLAASAYAADDTAKTKVEFKKGDGYESSRSSEYTTPDGVKHTSDTEVDVDVGRKGRINKIVEAESTKDPKGLMNKKKSDTITEIEEKERGGYEQKTTSKYRDADGTNVTLVTTTDVEVDKQGNVTATVETKKTVDPEGLMNKKTTTTKIKTVNGKVVEQEKDVD